MRRLAWAVPLFSLLLLAACDSGSPGPDGPLALGIIAGNNQVGSAGAERLPDPVVGKLVREPDSGGITFHLVTPAYAQGTVVQGSPVAGAVVCAVSVEGQLEAFTPCTNTDSNGQATFFFAPGTTVGEARAEIRGTLEGEPAVFDTVVAQVEPGAVETVFLPDAAPNVDDGGAFWFPPDMFADAYGNIITPTLSITGEAFALAPPQAGSPTTRPGIVVAPGAEVGDTAILSFQRDGVEILRALAELTDSPTPDHWGVKFTRQ